MNFQSIVSFFTSPFGIVILIGTFSTLARMFKSAQEQQAMKRANHDLQQAQRDSLRTGSQASAGSSASLAPLQTQSSKQTKKANWDQKQQTRKDRIEQLRAQRIEQLTKLRQQRSSGGQPQPTQPTAQPSRTLKPLQPQARPSQPRPTNISQARTPTPSARVPAQAPQAHKRPVAQPYAQQSQRRSAQGPPQTQPAPRRRPQPKAVVQQSQRQASNDSRRVSSRPSNSPIALGSIANQTPTKSSNVRVMFRQDLRRAIIAKEILAAPIGLRSQGSDLMGSQ